MFQPTQGEQSLRESIPAGIAVIYLETFSPRFEHLRAIFGPSAPLFLMYWVAATLAWA
jgi:hypothetical protein